MLRRILDWSTRDWALKLTALALAFLLWTIVRADAPAQWNGEVRVRVQSADPRWVLAAPPSPTTVTVVFRGPSGELLRTASERPEVIVPIDSVTDSSEVHVLRRNWVLMPPGTDRTEIIEFLPSSVQLTFDRITTRVIPIATQLSGVPAPGYEVAGPVEVEPIAVRASGAESSLERIDSLRLRPIALGELSPFDTVVMTIDTVGTGLIISPRTVRIFVPLQPVLGDTGASGRSLLPPRRPGDG